MSSERQGFTDTRSFLTIDNDAIDTSSVIQLAETDGTLKMSLYGKSAGTLTAFGVDSEGRLKADVSVPELDNITEVLERIAFSLQIIAGA